MQAFLTITIANFLVLIPMLLNSHAGTKYGIPYPVFARAFYGVRGANLAALLRAFVACGWFGIQTWIGGQAIYTIIGRLAGSGWTNASGFGGQPWTMWLSFAAFWLVQMLLIWRGTNALRRFENWAAPLVTVAFTALLVYMLVKAGGIGPILHQSGSLGWGSRFPCSCRYQSCLALDSARRSCSSRTAPSPGEANAPCLASIAPRRPMR